MEGHGIFTKLIVSGYISFMGEPTETKDKKAVVSFGTYGSKSKDCDKEKYPDIPFRVTVWENLAIEVTGNMKKGDAIEVEGRYYQEVYNGKTTNHIKAYRVSMREVNGTLTNYIQKR